MDLKLAGKTAVVVGGSSNIGRAAVLAFAREGANVVIAARHQADCEKVAELAKDRSGGKQLVVPLDAIRYDDVERLAQRTVETFGGIDIFVGSIGWDSPGDFLEVSRTEWQGVIESNYVFTLNYFHVLLPIMLEQGHGTIITVSSVMGRRGDPLEPVYAGTKAAQILFSQCMARQYGRKGVRINVVAPGPTPPVSFEMLGGDSLWRRPEQGEVGWRSVAGDDGPALVPVAGGPQASLLDATALGKFGTAEDVAAAILFLASDVTAGHMTGQVIGVDGGLYMPH
jgi:NAD(P)-dependent dehydrogenase (short-subunit alcohol dehydrogenase family)